MKKIPRKENSVIIKPKKIKQIPKKEESAVIQLKKIPRKEEQLIVKKEKIKQIPKKEESAVIKQQNPIYFKIGHEESIESKKDLLILEASLLNILKIMKSYNSLRTEELQIKLDMYKAMKGLDLSMKKTKSIFPFLEIPERLKRKEIIKIEPVREIKPVEDVLEDNIEIQLRDIQSRLKSLSG